MMIIDILGFIIYFDIRHILSNRFTRLSLS